MTYKGKGERKKGGERRCKAIWEEGPIKKERSITKDHAGDNNLPVYSWLWK